MSKNAVRNFLKKLKAMDEVPEPIIDAACDMADEVIEEEEIKEKETGDDVPEVAEEVKVEAKAPEIEKVVADAVNRALLKAGVIRDEAMAQLDACTEDAEGEEEVTVDPSDMQDEDEVKEIIGEARPAIASIKDAKTRKLIADSFAKLARMKRNTTNDYAFIQQAISNNKKQNMQDAASAVVEDDYSVGSDIAKKYNPHYKEVK